MRSVVRAAWQRSQTVRALLISLSLLFVSSNAFAQSSVGRAANAATGQSLRDAVEQNQKDFIDREVLGSTAGSLPGGAAAVTGLDPWRHHDPLKVPPGELAKTTYAWDTRERSAFVNGVYVLPGTVLGGQLKVSAFGGHNWLSLKMKDGGGNILDTTTGQFGEARNESVLLGGAALWSQKNTYVLASVVGTWGETSLSDAIDFCGLSCVLRRYHFDTHGFIGSLTAGNVFQLSGSPTGPMLDLRGSVGHTQNIGDTFANHLGDEQTWKFSTWTLTGSTTLFANIPLQSSALLRPYLQGYVRQEIGYRNRLHFHLHTGETGIVDSDQAHTYGGAEFGLTYKLGNMTVGGSMYSELSGDERTLGARLSASWKLGGEGTQRQSAQASPTPRFSWTGLYFGASAGYASSDVDMTNLGPDTFFAPVGGSDTVSPRGWVGGGQIGYNWQIGGFVVGVEGAWNLPSLNDERAGTFQQFLLGFVGDHWIAEISQLYAITGRLGVANGNWLPYVKGGLAGAKVETSMNRLGDPNFISQSKNWHGGWTIGGGVEYMLAQNFTVGLEYNYYNFESKNVSAIRTNDLGIDNWTVSPDNVQTITARMNYKLN